MTKSLNKIVIKVCVWIKCSELISECAFQSIIQLVDWQKINWQLIYYPINHFFSQKSLINYEDLLISFILCGCELNIFWHLLDVLYNQLIANILQIN